VSRTRSLLLALLLCGGSGLAHAQSALPPAAPTIAVIVSPERAEESINLAAVSLIFQRKRLFWSDGHRVLPLNLPAGEALRERFSLAVIGRSSDELEDYWNRLYYQGLRPPYVVGSSEAMLRYVEANRDAIGYVDWCASDARVSVVGVIDDQGHWRKGAPAVPPDCGPAAP